MSDKTYNGWTNYETWNVKLWLDNEPSTAYDVDALAREERDEYTLAKQIRAYVDELPEIAAVMENASMAADLLGAALDSANWQEIAASYIEDCEEEED